MAVLAVRAEVAGPQQPAADPPPAGASRPAPGASRGALVICGGGGLPESVAGVRPAGRRAEGEDRGHPDGQRRRRRAGRRARRVPRALDQAGRRVDGLAPHPIAGEGR